MMQVNFVPRDQPMTESEVDVAYSSGWFLAGSILATRTGQIAVPGQDMREQGWYNLWIRPEPLLPVANLLEAIRAIMEAGGDLETLDLICRGVFGMPLGQVIRNDHASADSAPVAGASVDVRPVSD